jgi:hypothetical protein
MNWSKAFLRQADSDYYVFEKINELNVHVCHELHYLQMFSEKLAKHFMCGPNGTDMPARTHTGLLKMLRTIKTNPTLGRKLGHPDAAAFSRFVDSLLPIANVVERLAPALTKGANPEYPWKDSISGEMGIPCEYPFQEFVGSRIQITKLVKLLRSLIVVSQTD